MCATLLVVNSTGLLQLLKSMGSSSSDVVMSLCKDLVTKLCEAGSYQMGGNWGFVKNES